MVEATNYYEFQNRIKKKSLDCKSQDIEMSNKSNISIIDDDFTLNICNCNINIHLRFLEKSHVEMNECYQPFLQLRKVKRNAPNMDITIMYKEITQKKGKLIFDSEHFWRIFEGGYNRLRFEFVPRLQCARTGELDRIAICDKTFRSIKLYCNRQLFPKVSEYPLVDGLDRIFLVSFLSMNSTGILMHCCGVVDDGYGLIFVGSRGVGKSTLARLWSTEGDAEILSDECIGIRLVKDQPYIYGTPWFSNSRKYSNYSAPLKKIFLLSHSQTNRARRISANNAFRNLAVHTILPFWDEVGLKNSLDFLSKIALDVPSYELEFFPDKKIIEFIREIVENDKS
jgi:hypothetical protein